MNRRDPHHDNNVVGCSLRRLAPGALLMLAVLGPASARCAAAGALVSAESPKIERAALPLTGTIAEMIGVASRAQVRTSIHCAGLSLHQSPRAALAVETSEARRWHRSPELAVVLTEGLRFVSRSIEPPAPRIQG